MRPFHDLRRLALTLRRMYRGPLAVHAGERHQKALLCYLQQPFRTRAADHLHSNRVEARAIASVLHDHGWGVDAIDFDSEYPIRYGNYDLLVGFGRAFDRSFYGTEFSGKRILFMTGAHPTYSNKAEIARLLAFQQRHGRLLTPRRSVFEPCDASFAFSDAVFCIGNEWTISTFGELLCPVYRLPAPYVPLKHEIAPRDLARAARQFMWFGSVGAVHKGLDLLLEAFRTLPTCHLHVCGPVQAEVDFFQFYRADLLDRPNVHFHGLVDLNSSATADLFRTCAFAVLPSCSEGGGSSVITAMSAGLVPIVTEEASVDASPFGIRIDGPTVNDVLNAVERAASLAPGDILTRSVAALDYARQTHSLDSYRAAFGSALISAVTGQ